MTSATLAAPPTVTLLHADGSVAFADFPVGALLRTRALGRDYHVPPATAAVARLCEHFEGHGTCNRGHKCRFAHRAAAHRRSLAASTSSSETAPIAAAGGSDSSGRRVATDGSTHHVPSAVTNPPQPTACNDHHHEPADLGAPALPRSHQARNTVQTSSGWRHAAYSASPLMF